MRNGSRGSILDIRSLSAHCVFPSGRNRPNPDARRTRKLTFERPLPDQIQPFGRQSTMLDCKTVLVEVSNPGSPPERAVEFQAETLVTTER